MVIEDLQAGERFEVVIESVTEDDFKTIKKGKDRFNAFDWSKYKGREVYKLRKKDDQIILGLMCLRDFSSEEGMNALEIELLEVSAENRPDKRNLQKNRFLKIAGCLIAFACRESFKRGYQGWIFLIPKSYLIEHYSRMYGFIHVPLRTGSRPEGFMALDTMNSIKLIKEYLD